MSLTASIQFLGKSLMADGCDTLADYCAWSGRRGKVRVLMTSPGLVKTDMAIRGLAAVGMDIEKWDWPGVPVLLPAESAAKLLGLVERADSIKSGSFLSYDGSEIGW